MAKKTLPTFDQLRQLFEYDGLTGFLFWKIRDSSMFADANPKIADGRAHNWNKRFAGKRAGHDSQNGYRSVDILGKPYREHRVIWAMLKNEWPETIDHINGDKRDNREFNLRNISQAENLRNLPKSTRNKSGVIGVSWDSRSGKWRAQIKREKTCDLGLHATLEDAAAARQRAELKYGFHENHGRPLA